MIFRTLRTLILLTCSAVGCTDQVPLGSWGRASDANGPSEPIPECFAVGAPGPTYIPSARVAVTVPYTDWTVPVAYDSIEIEMRIETDTVADGYLFTHEIPFAGGPTALLALQVQGGYQAEPPNGPVVRTKIAQFWISGTPLEWQLGDITFPDARAYPDVQVGIPWLTINARFDWQACRTYRLRLASDGVEVGRGTWYGAWIVDTETSAETLLGRILVPDSYGGLTSPTSSWSNRIGWALLDTCSDVEHASAIFGSPTTNAGGATPAGDRFGEPAACGNSRIVDFSNAVRHEIGDAL